MKSILKCLCFIFSDKGDLFGWGNSEYNQLSMVTDHAQENVPRYLPLRNCGKIIKAAAGGSICAILNGELKFLFLSIVFEFLFNDALNTFLSWVISGRKEMFI